MPDTPAPDEVAERPSVDAALEALEESDPVDAPEAADAVAAALQQELDEE